MGVSDRVYPGFIAPELAGLGGPLNPRGSQAQPCVATLCFSVVRRQEIETEKLAVVQKIHSKHRETEKSTQEH